MRFVIYDDETLEPITVVNIPGLAEKDIEAHGCRYRLVVPREIGPMELSPSMPVLEAMRVVDLKFIPLMRAHVDGRIQGTWMCFTKQDELALLLTPDWLPGQRGAIQEIERQRNQLFNLLVTVLGEQE